MCEGDACNEYVCTGGAHAVNWDKPEVCVCVCMCVCVCVCVCL